ncbi:hypothetical protein [Nocardia sp. NPDC127526]|uniref:hypothetical protein n=1 Tax=Nocardia sp. NPDC127526 TaxID=3345393 RepID=UPI003640B411
MKNARLVLSVLGLLIGIGLVVGGGIGLSQSDAGSASGDSLSSELAAEGFPQDVNVAVLLKSSSARMLEPSEIGPLYLALGKLPGVRSVGMPTGEWLREDRTAAVLPMIMDSGIDSATAKTTIEKGLAPVTVPDDLSVTILGVAERPVSLPLSSWIAVSCGVIIVFASGAIAFARTPAPDAGTHAGEQERWAGMTQTPGSSGRFAGPAVHSSSSSDGQRHERTQLVVGGFMALLTLAGMLSLFSTFEVPPSGLTSVPSVACLTVAVASFAKAIQITRTARRNR